MNKATVKVTNKGYVASRKGSKMTGKGSTPAKAVTDLIKKEIENE